MMPNMTYTRRLSTTEVREKRIMILKDKVGLFPETGKTLSVRIKGKDFKTRVIEESCTCQGPDKPHVHWFLDASTFIHLVSGKRPTIVIKAKGRQSLELEITNQS